MATTVKREDLQRWVALDALRRRHASESATIRSEMDQIEGRLEAALVESGQPSIKRHGFTLALTPGRGSVSWATEYLKACGADAVDKLKAAAAASAKKVFVLTPPK